ncbi:VP2 [Kummerowia striata gokushovirus]|nr:VP2 [Kummerowia striata gokushovirus]
MPLPLIGAAIGGGAALIGAGVNYFGQKDTNETNLNIARETNAFNAAQADKAMAFNREEASRQMQFQEQMSSSAYQRAMRDMKASGLNPLLAISQGGASSPSGASGSGVAASGSAARVENAGRYLGEGLASVVPSAMGFMKTAKELEQADASIASQKAGALAAVAQANNANASAQATQASMRSITAKARSAESEADAAIAEAATRKTTAEYDKQAAAYDAVTKRVLHAIDGVSSAASIGKALQSIRNAGRDQTMKEERHLRQQGLKGTVLK